RRRRRMVTKRSAARLKNRLSLPILLGSVPLCLPVWQAVSLGPAATRPKRRKLSRLSRRRQALKAVLAMIVVGLTPRHLGPLTPRLSALARDGAMRSLETISPAVTCSVQASFMTGLTPRDHGIVANGWLFRDLSEVMLWRQSNRLVGGEKIWEAGKRR